MMDFNIKFTKLKLVLFCFSLSFMNIETMGIQTENEHIPDTTKCFHGDQLNMTEEACTESKQMCGTEVRINNGMRKIKKGCVVPMICVDRESENKNHCKGFSSSNDLDSVCYFCCVGDLCNNMSTAEEWESVYKIISKIEAVPILK